MEWLEPPKDGLVNGFFSGVLALDVCQSDNKMTKVVTLVDILYFSPKQNIS